MRSSLTASSNFRQAERRAAAAARRFHLEPAARPRLAAWTCGSRASAGRPEAELHIFAGPAVYGDASFRERVRDGSVLARAERWPSMGCGGMRRSGARRWRGVGRARVMLYRGDPGETFCLALAEAQAMGVPAVVQPLGSVGERVVDGQTGRVAVSDGEFAEAAIAVLRDDELWQRWHRAALATQRGLELGRGRRPLRGAGRMSEAALDDPPVSAHPESARKPSWSIGIAWHRCPRSGSRPLLCRVRASVAGLARLSYRPRRQPLDR